jgi:hypothetical protein
MSSEDNAIEFMLKTLELQGAAISTVSDGHVIMFKKNYLLELLKQNPESEKLVIFLKRPEFKN